MCTRAAAGPNPFCRTGRPAVLSRNCATKISTTPSARHAERPNDNRPLCNDAWLVWHREPCHTSQQSREPVKIRSTGETPNQPTISRYPTNATKYHGQRSRLLTTPPTRGPRHTTQATVSPTFTPKFAQSTLPVAILSCTVCTANGAPPAIKQASAEATTQPTTTTAVA